MNASFARRLDRLQTALIALSAPTLLAEPKPLRPQVAVAPLAESLSLRERFLLARVRNLAVCHA